MRSINIEDASIEGGRAGHKVKGSIEGELLGDVSVEMLIRKRLEHETSSVPATTRIMETSVGEDEEDA